MQRAWFANRMLVGLIERYLATEVAASTAAATGAAVVAVRTFAAIDAIRTVAAKSSSRAAATFAFPTRWASQPSSMDLLVALNLILKECTLPGTCVTTILFFRRYFISTVKNGGWLHVSFYLHRDRIATGLLVVTGVRSGMYGMYSPHFMVEGVF